MGEQDNMWVCKSGVGEDVQGCVRQRRSESCSFCCLPGYKGQRCVCFTKILN